MSRIGYYALIFVLFIGLLACGKKEEATPTEETAVPQTPQITSGEMVLIPAGEHLFGTDDSQIDREGLAHPEQKGNLPAFWIDKYEVTNKDYLDFAIKTQYVGEGDKEGRSWRTFFTAEKAFFPVVYITWSDAAAYCKAQGRRLPTEFEWEKAARGTDGKRYPWGNQWENNKSNTYEAGLMQPAAVAQYPGDVSTYGAHDMLGNVQEWTDSWFKPYKGNTKKNENWGERWRVVRGLSYGFYGSRGSLASRSASLPNALYNYGFRCAKDATPEEAAKGAPAK
jgi:formylglycine-generating enzyme required for sulfatase activity